MFWINFVKGDPHKVYIGNMEREFEELLVSNVLEHYDGTILYQKKKS